MRDPIQFELIRNAYWTVGEEMGVALALSAYSTMTQQRPARTGGGEGGGGGIFDRNGGLITGPGLLHSSAVRPTLKEIMKDFKSSPNSPGP